MRQRRVLSEAQFEKLAQRMERAAESAVVRFMSGEIIQQIVERRLEETRAMDAIRIAVADATEAK